MGRQINFFMMHEDVAELDVKIKELGLVAVADCVKSNNIEIVTKLIDVEDVSYFVLPEEIDDINLFYTNEIFLYRIKPLEYPVIEYMPSKLINNSLHFGRLYFEKEYFNKDNKFVEKQQQLIQKTTKLFTWYKNKYKKYKIDDYYISTLAYKLGIKKRLF